MTKATRSCLLVRAGGLFLVNAHIVDFHDGWENFVVLNAFYASPSAANGDVQ